jgi:hypothetical protein
VQLPPFDLLDQRSFLDPEQAKTDDDVESAPKSRKRSLAPWITAKR